MALAERIGNFFFLHIMGRWVAGAKAQDAVGYCRRIGGRCEVNYLGEHYKESALAQVAVEEYERLIDQLAQAELGDASITIKPSQFGLSVLDTEDPVSFCEEMMLKVASYAEGKKIFVWLDMEGSGYTDFTIEFYKKHGAGKRMGICLQANLKRTPTDLRSLISICKESDITVRLVKGIYPEKAGIALTDARQIHAAFLSLIKTAFMKGPENLGIAVASHHPEPIELALTMQERYKKRFFQIQVLKGIMPSYYKELRKRGVPLVEYVPYGKEAFAYSVRRAMKSPRFAKSFLFSFFFDAYRKEHG